MKAPTMPGSQRDLLGGSCPSHFYIGQGHRCRQAQHRRPEARDGGSSCPQDTAQAESEDQAGAEPPDVSAVESVPPPPRDDEGYSSHDPIDSAGFPLEDSSCVEPPVLDSSDSLSEFLARPFSHLIN